MNVLVSIIIPVYNRIFELKRAINSVLTQTVQDFEILVIDDYSEIELQTVCQEFNDARIKYRRLEKKGNANVCRNEGIKQARGQYIAMLDSDDEWLPEHLEKRIKFIEENNADGVFGSYYLDNGTIRHYKLSRPLRENEKMVNYLLSDGSAVTPSHFYKSECVKDVLWDETFYRHQDFDFSIRFSKKYKFIASTDLTCIVHWKKGEKRTEHFESLMRFINLNKSDIDPIFYCKYHRQIYSNIVDRQDISKKIKSHYAKESVRHIRVLSLTDYMSTFGNNKSKIVRLFLRLKFCLKVIFD